ncbi:acyl-CoA dehydrogenase family protein [Mycetocola zhadangensis]|uniref:acyl-CoA dehydrogenase family protein n=1 Tax=Mycetocola zhadangensis TaxID=1164595 RepID=UPI003A4E25CC
MNPNELRRMDLTLSEEHESIQDLFANFFAKQSPTTVARAAEPTGFDEGLWDQIVDLGVTRMAIPESAGGDGAGILELTLVAEELGRAIAPVPLIEHIVATRLLAASGDSELEDFLEEAANGDRILGLALQPLSGRQFVSTAAVARDIVGFDGENLVIVTSSGARAHVGNQASLPFAWVDPGEESVRVVRSSGAERLYSTAQREWKTLTAAALAGMTEASLAIAVKFVKTRETMGVIVGTLQGISFPLADVSIGIEGARNLARRAAWFLDNEPETEAGLQAAAIAYASGVAMRGTTTTAHAQGGLGFTVEADASLYFLRAKGWALAGGSPLLDLKTVGELRISAVTAANQSKERRESWISAL